MTSPTNSLACTGAMSLIPRASFFGNPARQRPIISPDARWIAWLAPVDGVANLWIASRDAPECSRPLTNERVRAPAAYRFAHDGQHILYLRDRDGDENTHVFALDLETGSVRDLTPVEGARCELMALSPLVPGAILVRINDRDARYHDVYRIDLGSGERILVEHNEGYSGFIADQQFTLRIARKPCEDGSSTVLLRNAAGAWAEWFNIPEDDVRTTMLSHLDAAGTTLFFYDSRGRDTAALSSIALGSDRPQVLAHDMAADVDRMLVDPVTHTPVAWSSEVERRAFHPLGSSHASDIQFLDARGIGDWMVGSTSLDGRYWVVHASSDTRPGIAHLYDRQTKSLTVLLDTRPELNGVPLTPMHALRLTARDGLVFGAYVSLPIHTAANPPGLHPPPTGPLPLVVVVHGGPATRDSFGYDAESQWLANRGYAVLKVNYRGSLGFGKTFLAAGYGQWGLKMSDDIDDAVEWLVKRGIVDPTRVAITGGSYGGYAVLVALTRTPEKYACGVDLVGPSNLETLIASIPPYWAPVRKAFLRQLADPETAEGRDALRAQSPLSRAGAICRPLLIGQGANDPRVKQAEADQMVAAMKSNGVPVTYALFPDEGHGFGRPSNAICFAAIQEMFLARYLGGTAEPLKSEDMTASSVRLEAGGEWLSASREE